MPTATVGVFTINYTLYTNAQPGFDIQFGMDFTLTSTTQKPLSQLIFPATAVGTNLPGRWNIDNHRPGNDPQSLVFGNADGGTITDGPREISPAGRGTLATKFAVYIVDIASATIQSKGVQFGYGINTSVAAPQTTFTPFAASTITNEQKAALLAKCAYLKFA